MTTLETVVSAEQWMEQAIAASAAGQFAEARICVQKALEADPQNAELILAGGHVKLGLNDLTASRRRPFQPRTRASVAGTLR